MFNTNVTLDVIAINGIIGLAQGIFADKTAEFVVKKGNHKDNLALIFDTLFDILQNDVTGYKLSIYLQGQSLISVRWALKLLKGNGMTLEEMADKLVGQWYNRDSIRWSAAFKLLGILFDKLSLIQDRQISFKAQTSIYKYQIVGDDMVLEEIAQTGIKSLFFRDGFNEEFGLRVPEAPFFSGHLSIEHDGKRFNTYGWINPRTMNKWQSWLLDIHNELSERVKAEVGQKVKSFIGGNF